MTRRKAVQPRAPRTLSTPVAPAPVGTHARRSALGVIAAGLGLLASTPSLAQGLPERRLPRSAAPQAPAEGAAAPLRALAPELMRLPASEEIGAFAVGDGELLAVTRAGVLLRLSGKEWLKLADGFDPLAPLAAGHGRIAGRSLAGWLRVFEGGKIVRTAGPRLAPFGGFINLPDGIIAVTGPHVAGGSRPKRGEEGDAADPLRATRLVRFSFMDGWRESARSDFVVMPDARPLLVELDCPEAGPGPGGQLVVLAGPSELRYRHGVLGDGVEATQLIYAACRSLTPLAMLELADPYVFEDVAPRRFAELETGHELLATVQSGPQGAALVLVGRPVPGGAELEIIAQGPPLGTRNRWMAPIVVGHRLYAIHTPHIGGVLTGYRRVGARLLPTRLRDGVSNHSIGSRNTNLATPVGTLLIVPSQSHRELVALDLEADAAPRWRVALEAPVVALAAVGEQVFLLDARGRAYAASLR